MNLRSARARDVKSRGRCKSWMKRKKRIFFSDSRWLQSSGFQFKCSISSSRARRRLAWLHDLTRFNFTAWVICSYIIFPSRNRRTTVHCWFSKDPTQNIRCDDIIRIHIMHENRKPEKITRENSQKKRIDTTKLAQQCRWHHQSHFCCYSDVSSWLKIRSCRVEKAECVGGGFV